MDLEETLRQAIAAAKEGHSEEARRLLETVLDADERNEQAWLWLSGVVDSDEERAICLENVLAINPGNVPASQGLAALRAEGGGRGAARSASPPPPVPSPQPVARSPQSSVPAAPVAQPGRASPQPAASAVARRPGRTSEADRRVFIAITIVLILVLVCIVASILAYVAFSPLS
jgi:hypothetical protein